MKESEWNALADKAANACDASFRTPNAQTIKAALDLINETLNSIPANKFDRSKHLDFWNDCKKRWEVFVVTGKPLPS